MTTDVLYRSQAAASDVFRWQLFPCYSQEYVASQGIKLWCYSKAYTLIYDISGGLQRIASTIVNLGNNTIGRVMRPLLDFAYPINPINNHRHFVCVSRSIEKWLGDYIFRSRIQAKDCDEFLPGTSDLIAEKVTTVFSRVKDANQDLLNPPEEAIKFDYRVKILHSKSVNAFAVPAGGVVVFSEIVKKVYEAIQSNAILESTVEFADGSKAKVNLSQVTLEDVLAALIGHEMTHIASRHSILAFFAKLIRITLMRLGRFSFINYLKLNDREYQVLRKKEHGTLQPQAALAAKEEFYSDLNYLFEWLGQKADSLIRLFRSRSCEYEADVTGTYFAHRAKFNPLGALYLQEFLNQSSCFEFLEFLSTHPCGKNRKRAVFAGISEIAPELLARVNWDIAQNGYDFERSSPAIRFAYVQSQKSIL